MTAFVSSILSFILGLSLFFGGLILILSKMPFWGQFLGVPAIIIGLAFTILTFDRLNQLSLGNEE